MVNTVGHTIYKEINTQNIRDNTVGVALFQLTVYNIIVLRCRSQYFNWIENSVHLRDFQQCEIHFICILPGRFWTLNRILILFFSPNNYGFLWRGSIVGSRGKICRCMKVEFIRVHAYVDVGCRNWWGEFVTPLPVHTYRYLDYGYDTYRCGTPIK